MTQTETSKWQNLCRPICWLGAIACGIFLGTFLLSSQVHPVLCILIALITALVLSWVFPKLFCHLSTDAVDNILEPVDVPVERPVAQPLAAVAEEAVVEPVVKKVAKKAPAKKTAPKVPAKKATKAPAAAKAAPKAPAKKKTPAKPKLFRKPPAKIDDLKQISGVGPKLEETLHKVGVYQFQQVASWTKTDIRFVDDQLSFKGRIERDGWVKQAKKLMKIK